MTDDTIRILIASSDLPEILQREIIEVLTPDEKFKIVGIAKRVDDTIQLGRLTKPHIFLVNDILQDGDAIQLIRVLSHSFFQLALASCFLRMTRLHISIRRCLQVLGSISNSLSTLMNYGQKSSLFIVGESDTENLLKQIT